jgi:hypothetical protein
MFYAEPLLNLFLVLVVCYKIFWIRGKALRILIKNRAKANNEKTMTDLETAIEEFTVKIKPIFTG